MESSFHPDFTPFFANLPPHIRKKAIKQFEIFERFDRQNMPLGLDYKPVKGHKILRSIRIDGCYRALGDKIGDGVQWHWIGHHDEYMRRIKG